MTATGWTLDELTARVAGALDGAAYAGAPNGRVRDVPDARAIRWYATIGLVDRPAMRGRVALYGPRHLLQLVAIKRLQSQGMRIADIQAALAEAPDEVLRSIASGGDGALTDGDERPPGGGEEGHRAAAGEVAPDGGRSRRGSPRGRFWTEPPDPPQPPEPAGPGNAPVQEFDTPNEAETVSALLSGVPLGGGVVLLLPGAPDIDDIPVIRAAARELLDLLAARGLTTGPPKKTGSAE